MKVCRKPHRSTSSAVRRGHRLLPLERRTRRNISKTGGKKGKSAKTELARTCQAVINLTLEEKQKPYCSLLLGSLFKSLSPFSQLQIHFQAPMRYKCKEETEGFNIYRCSGGRQLWSLKRISDVRLCLGLRLFFQGELEGKKTVICHDTSTNLAIFSTTLTV